MEKEIVLKEHNLKIYDAIKNAYKNKNHIAVVQATGTGKSYLIANCIEDMGFKRVLFLAPSLHIINQFKSNFSFMAGKVEFMTYKKLTYIKNFQSFLERSEYDFIVLDEYHRCGARTWIGPVKKILSFYKDKKVLGVTATPVRFLDSGKDMTQELFGSSPISELSLASAIKQNILPKPKYVLSYYNIKDDIEKLRLKKENVLGRDDMVKDMNYIINSIEKLSNVNDVLKNNISKERKFIVFCSNINHLNEMLNIVSKWFNDIGFNVKTYSVYTDVNNSSLYLNSQIELEKFKNAKSDEKTVHLLFSINMLNEGVHIEDVDGLIFLRKTVSPIILYQQLGRSFSAGIKHTPIIFDFVNNIKGLSFYDEKIIGSKLPSLSEDLEITNIIKADIEVIDYKAQIDALLAEIDQLSFDNSLNALVGSLKRYKDEHGHCDVSSNHPLYKKCRLLRTQYRNGAIDKKVYEALDALGFSWEKSIYNDLLWDNTFIKLEKFKEVYGHTNVPRSYEDKQLATWVHTQRKYKDTMLESRKKRLLELGFEFEVAKKKNDEEWEMMYQKLLEFKKEFGHVNVSSRYKDKKLANWVNSQRKAYKAGKLDEYRYDKLVAIGFVFSKSKTG